MGEQERCQELSASQPYRTLLAVSQAIVSQRDLHALFHDLADRLQQVVRFDYLTLVLHDAATDTMRMHVLEPPEPTAPPIVLPPGDDPAGLVWQTQQPLITTSVAELSRWPRLLERVQSYGVQSYCWLPLTTAWRRLGTLVLTSKQPSTYDTADVAFLQHVADQVAVAVENALAFREIEALKDKLAKENAYLEEEARTQHNFGEVVGESAALRRVLKEVETVAPTGSTVLIRGETGTGKELIARALHDLSPRRGRTAWPGLLPPDGGARLRRRPNLCLLPPGRGRGPATPLGRRRSRRQPLPGQVSLGHQCPPAAGALL
jgi:formate hydrogenlyase transcriptional activator